jgi:hypothetical protein
VHAQHVPARQVQPGEHDHLGPRREAANRIGDRLVEDQPRLRRPLIALLRGEGAVDQRGLDPSDRPQLEDLRRAQERTVMTPIT